MVYIFNIDFGIRNINFMIRCASSNVMTYDDFLNYDGLI